MKKSLNHYVAVYKDLLMQGDVQIAYRALRKYMLTLRAHFSNELSDKYSFSNVSPGYMDYSYFSFFDDYLRSLKLRLSVVLNYQEIH